MKISNFNFNTKSLGKKSTKPEDYDFKGFGDSLVSSAMNRLNEAKSPAPQVTYEGDTVDTIYGNSGINDTNYNFLTNSEPTATLREGARIKNDVYEVAKNYYPEAEIKGVFDNISNEEIEANIQEATELAQNLEKSNPGFSPNSFVQKALSLFLAAGKKGDKNATNTAYKLAYTPLPTNPADNKNEGKSAGDDISTEDYDTENTLALSKFSTDNDKNKDVEYESLSNSYDPDDSKWKFYDSYNKPFGKETNNNLLNSLLSSDSNLFNKTFIINLRKLFDPNYENRQKYDATSNVYYGVAVKTENGKFPDLDAGQMSKNQIIDTLGISEKDFIEDVEELEKGWKSLVKLGSIGKMQPVLLDMVDHFMEGSGDDYSNDILTETVSNHKVTKKFMTGFSNVFNDFISKTNGDIGSFANSQDFKDALRADGLILSQYAYEGLDAIKGLGLAIHGWSVGEVNVKSFDIQPDGTYTGKLEFNFIDDFGLDSDDIKDFHGLDGFNYWFILQHYDKFEGKYKPFRTIVTIDYPISGKINK